MEMRNKSDQLALSHQVHAQAHAQLSLDPVALSSSVSNDQQLQLVRHGQERHPF